MANPNKAKGDRAERDVSHWFAGNGWADADRSLGAGRAQDRGDITGIDGYCIQVKDRGTLAVPQWMREVADQKANARADTGILIAKKRGTADVGEWYAAMTVADLNHLMLKADGR